MGFLDRLFGLLFRPNISKLAKERNTIGLHWALAHQDWRIRRDAAVVLVKLGEVPQVPDELVRMHVEVLERFPPAPRCSETTQALVTIGQPVVKPLCRIVEGQLRQRNGMPYHYAVPHIAEALAGIGNASAAAVLARRLRDLIKMEAQKLTNADPTALRGRDIGGAAGRAAFESAVKGKENISTKIEAAMRAADDIRARDTCLVLINALASLGGEVAKKAIDAARSSPHDDVRRAAQIALSSFEGGA